jgi:hypothetical protein
MEFGTDIGTDIEVAIGVELEDIRIDNVPKKLLILDLNGVLIHRVISNNINLKSKIVLGKFNILLRKGIRKFIDKCLAKYNVAIWSSVTKKNINDYIKLIFGDRENELIFVWDQTHCHAIPRKNTYPLFIKNLETVWVKFPQYNQNNTIIIDDSPKKMVNNPKCCVIIAKEWIPIKNKEKKDKYLNNLSNRLNKYY